MILDDIQLRVYNILERLRGDINRIDERSYKDRGYVPAQGGIRAEKGTREEGGMGIVGNMGWFNIILR